MPTIFVNGGAPNYAGWEFTTSTQIIDKLDTELTAAGWTTIAKVAATSLFVRGTSAGGHNCFVEFIVGTNGGQTNGRFLDIRGWLEQAKTNGSPASTHRLEYIEGSTNRLWLSADEGGGCITTYPTVGTMKGFHFGYPYQVLTTDQFGWYIGEISTYSYNLCYAAKSFITVTNWRQVGSDFNLYTTRASAASFPTTTLDYLALSMTNTASDVWTVVTNTNIAYLAHQGRVNPVDSAVILMPYGYLEGRGATTNYGQAGNCNLPFRGFIRFAYTGVSALNPAIPVDDPVSGFKILSVGGVGYQGMRIL